MSGEHAMNHNRTLVNVSVFTVVMLLVALRLVVAG